MGPEASRKLHEGVASASALRSARSALEVLREAAAEGLELVCSSGQAGYTGVAVMRGGSSPPS